MSRRRNTVTEEVLEQQEEVIQEVVEEQVEEVVVEEQVIEEPMNEIEVVVEETIEEAPQQAQEVIVQETPKENICIAEVTYITRTGCNAYVQGKGLRHFTGPKYLAMKIGETFEV